MYLYLYTLTFLPHLQKFRGRPSFCVYRQQVFFTVKFLKYGGGFPRLATQLKPAGAELSDRVQGRLFLVCRQDNRCTLQSRMFILADIKGKGCSAIFLYFTNTRGIPSKENSGIPFFLPRKF